MHSKEASSKMEATTTDIEAPEAVEQKGDDLSVDGTKSLDTTSERDSEDSVTDVVVAKDVNNVQESSTKRYRTIALMTTLIIIIALTVGLGVGLTNQNSSFSFVHSGPCKDKTPSKQPSEPEPELEPDSSSSSGDTVDNADPAFPEESLDSELPELPSKPPKISVGERLRWPELVGMPRTDALEFLQQLYGDTYEIVTVPNGGLITKDFRTDRIILYLDETDKVMSVPGVG
jgi:hypothetical protein